MVSKLEQDFNTFIKKSQDNWDTFIAQLSWAHQKNWATIKELLHIKFKSTEEIKKELGLK